MVRLHPIPLHRSLADLPPEVLLPRLFQLDSAVHLQHDLLFTWCRLRCAVQPCYDHDENTGGLRARAVPDSAASRAAMRASAAAARSSSAASPASSPMLGRLQATIDSTGSDDRFAAVINDQDQRCA